MDVQTYQRHPITFWGAMRLTGDRKKFEKKFRKKISKKNREKISNNFGFFFQFFLHAGTVEENT